MEEDKILGKTFETSTFRGKATKIVEGNKDIEAFNQKYVILRNNIGLTHQVPLKYFGKTAIVKEAS